MKKLIFSIIGSTIMMSTSLAQAADDSQSVKESPDQYNSSTIKDQSDNKSQIEVYSSIISQIRWLMAQRKIDSANNSAKFERIAGLQRKGGKAWKAFKDSIDQVFKTSGISNTDGTKALVLAGEAKTSADKANNGLGTLNTTVNNIRTENKTLGEKIENLWKRVNESPSMPFLKWTLVIIGLLSLLSLVSTFVIARGQAKIRKQLPKAKEVALTTSTPGTNRS